MKISRQTREIINIVIFFIVVALLLAFYVIYPLNRTADFYERPDIESYNPDSLAVNDASAYIDAGLIVDTFRVESDGLANIAAVMAAAPHSDWKSARGSAILLPPESANRDSLIELAAKLANEGINIVALDLRATGRSTGKYRGEGSFESDDLTAVIHYLSIRELIVEPLTVVGFSLGGDGAILAAHDNEVISNVIAVEPYLTTMRMQDELRERHDMLWFPFYRTVMWFWYEIRSGYAPTYRKTDDLKAVACPTLLVISPDSETAEPVEKLKELSDSQKLKIVTADNANLFEQVIDLYNGL